MGSEQGMHALHIPPEQKRRRGRGGGLLVALLVVIVVVGAIAFTATRQSERKPIPSPAPEATAATNAPAAPPKPGDTLLTVSGYVIPRERIAISPRFQGTVKRISVVKGDLVKQGDVLVELEDDEQRARLLE